jgi:hypothetical protein
LAVGKSGAWPRRTGLLGERPCAVQRPYRPPLRRSFPA